MPAELLQPKSVLKPSIQQVLYIDDDPSISTVVRYSLELFAGWYATATDGRYALEAAKSSPWDIILLEVGLEHGWGFNLHRQLKADPCTQAIPIVLLTSRIMPEDFQRYHQMAIAGVIAKPFDPVTLGAQIADLLA